MRFLYYLGAIGPEHYEHKINILFQNLDRIYENLGHKIDIIVNLYQDNKALRQRLLSSHMVENVFFHHKEGAILAELWKTNPHNHIMMRYEYVLFMLDDVEIKVMDIKEMVVLKEQHNLDILSPRVIGATHDYVMDHFNIPRQLYLVNMIEIYSLLLRPEALLKIFSNITIENKWIWGVDYLLPYWGFKLGILNTISETYHHYKLDASKGREATRLMSDFLKYNGTTLAELKNKYPTIIKKLQF